MRYLFGFVCVCALVGTLPQSASAQAGEEGTTSEPNLKEPATPSEPVPEEPALQLRLDDAGVGVAPGYPPRTVDGYTLKEMDRRVMRARIGLGVSIVAMTVVGPILVMAGAGASLTSCEWGGTEDCSPSEVPWLIAAGALVTVGGIGGTIASGVLLRRGKRNRDRFREAHYGTPRRVQWDLAGARLVF